MCGRPATPRRATSPPPSHGAGQFRRRRHPQNTSTTRARAVTETGGGRRGALQPRRHQRACSTPRRCAPRRAIRQEALERRAGSRGLEHLDITADRIKALGFDGLMMPVQLSCANHEGRARSASCNGTGRTGSSSPTGSSRTTRCWPMSRRPPRIRRGERDHPATASATS